MLKHLIAPTPAAKARGRAWLDLEYAAVVEFTSEEETHPVEAALDPKSEGGWRAKAPGPQTIRLIFEPPQRLRYVAVAFEEREVERTQEFVLRWSADGGETFKDIVRQQWNFSPPQTILESEEYQVDLCNVKVLELVITPDIGNGRARASLRSLRLSADGLSGV